MITNVKISWHICAGPVVIFHERGTPVDGDCEAMHAYRQPSGVYYLQRFENDDRIIVETGCILHFWWSVVQGYLAHKKPHLPRNLPQAYA